MGKLFVFLRIQLKFGSWLYKKRLHILCKFQFEKSSNKKDSAKKPLTNLYEMNSNFLSCLTNTLGLFEILLLSLWKMHYFITLFNTDLFSVRLESFIKDLNSHYLWVFAFIHKSHTVLWKIETLCKYELLYIHILTLSLPSTTKVTMCKRLWSKWDAE